MKAPAFAVIGHPNKGKSSIVSTLARNDAIKISPKSGTTVNAELIKVKTTHAQYELIDTPGFQRPTQVLAWLKKHADSADQRAAAVAEFVLDPDCQQRFPDEVQLLTPVVAGAAILYVVDGSRPYGAEYETEMEILRWTGRPSMALINPIEGETHVESWKNALSQFFKTVRIFNPMQAKFEAQIELLATFAHLNPHWSDTLNQVTDDLRQMRQNQTRHAAEILARLLVDLCQYRVSQKVLDEEQAKLMHPILSGKYRQWMTVREKQALAQLLALYAHHYTDLDLESLDIPADLFDSEQWYLFGLNKKQLAAASTLSGMATGAAADLAVAGHSFMLGAIGGGLIGLGSAIFGADKLVRSKIKGLPLGGFEATYGPVSNRNFPYVIIGRFLFAYQLISSRNHARRDALEVDNQSLNLLIKQLEKTQQNSLHQSCARLIGQRSVDDLSTVLLPLFSIENINNAYPV